MPRINKSDVMQKLIDELNLDPGLEAIPTELAEKVQATFQINDQAVEVTPPTANILRSAETTGTTDATIYTTPSTGKFYLTACAISSYATSGAGNAMGLLSIQVTIDGTVRDVYFHIHYQSNGAVTEKNTQFAFGTPLLIDAGTNVVLRTDNFNAAGDLSKATIIGYTTD